MGNRVKNKIEKRAKFSQKDLQMKEELNSTECLFCASGLSLSFCWGRRLARHQRLVQKENSINSIVSYVIHG